MGPHALAMSVAEHYANCATYRDRGVSAWTILNGETGRVQSRATVVFRTAFERASGRFLFEYRDKSIGPPHEWQRMLIVRRTDGRTQTYWSVRDEAREPRDLFHALGGATGVSHGTASMIPGLLLDGWRTRRLLRDSASLAVRERDGASYRVLRVSRGDLTWSDAFWTRDNTIWRIDHQRADATPQGVLDEVDQRTGKLEAHIPPDQIRQIRETLASYGETTSRPGPAATSYAPEFDQQLGDDDFVFDPGEAHDHGWIEGLEDPV